MMYVAYVYHYLDCRHRYYEDYLEIYVYAKTLYHKHKS
jgi:hypothetical protein